MAFSKSYSVRKTSMKKVLSDRVLVCGAITITVMATAAIFGFLYQRESQRWTRTWQGLCEERAEVLENGFRVSDRPVENLAEMVSSFYIAPPHVLNNTEFVRLAKVMLHGTSSVAPGVVRAVHDKDRAAYEAETGRPIVNYWTQQVAAHHDVYLILKLSPLYLPALNMDMYDDMFESEISNIITNSMQKGYQYQCTAPRVPFGLNTATQFLVLRTRLIYWTGEGVQTSPPIYGALIYHYDLFPAVEGFQAAIKDKDKMTIKIVDVTSGREKCQPLYISKVEEGAKRGSWSFGREYKYTAPLNILGDNREHELWCRPGPGQRFLPMVAVGWSAGTLVLGLALSQLLWIYLRDKRLARQQVQRALELKDEMAMAKKAAEDHSAAKTSFLASVRRPS